MPVTAALASASPVGNIDSPLGIFKAALALPAAGAFTAETAVALASGTRRITFWCKYTRAGGATGQPKFRLTWTDADGNTAIEPVNNAAAIVDASPWGQMNHFLGEWLGPTVSDATPIRWTLTFEVPAGAVAAALDTAEIITATPGTMQIEYCCSGML